MNLTIEKTALLQALDRVRSVVEARNTIPILSNVKLAVEDGRLTVTATDLDMEASATVESGDLAAVDGAITVPATLLYDLVRKLAPGADVQLAYDREDPRLSLKSGRSRFNLPVLPAGDFPQMDASSLGRTLTVSAKGLARLLDMTMFAMSTEETRYYLNGLYLHVRDGRLRSVSTDGHRLALCDMAPPDGSEGDPSLLAGVIVPRKTVREVRRMIEGLDTITLQVSPTKVCVWHDQARLISKVVDGHFPDYERVIPKDNPNEVRIDAAAMLSSVDRVATISAEKARSTKFNFDSGTVTLSSRNTDGGKSTEEAEIDYDGPAVEISFNARYVMDVMSRISGEQAVLRLGDPASPALILDGDDPLVQFVMMPLRT